MASVTYEYKTVANDPSRRFFRVGPPVLDGRLNELAAEGWEIVSTAGASRGFFLFGIGELLPVHIVLLRRPLGTIAAALSGRAQQSGT